MRQRLLTITLVLLAIWAAVGAVEDLFFVHTIFALRVPPGGVLAGRLFEGDLIVLGLLWAIAAFNPTRFRWLVWLAALTEVIAIASYVLHASLGDVAWHGVWLPLVISALFLVSLLALLLTPDMAVRGVAGTVAWLRRRWQPSRSTE